MLRTTHLLAALCAALITLAGCSPKFDWREIPGTSAPYVVMLPAKPAWHTREIDLDGIPLTMTMAGAEIDGVTFAVGSAALPDPARASHALTAMRTALVRNIRGTVVDEKRSPPNGGPMMITIEARGPAQDGQRLLLARFIAKDQHIYQLVVTGPEREVSREAADTFFTSFRLR